MKRYLSAILFGACALAVSAQVSTVPYPVDKVFTKVTAKGKGGEIKAQKIKGKINGMGMMRSKEGQLYAGDFYDKMLHGKGMLLAAPGQELAGLPGGAYYVGRFRQGLKNGKGRVYNRDGELIYEGRFKDDAPAETYPSKDLHGSWFTELSNPDATYIGEMMGESPSGFGIMLFPSGAYMISNFADGAPTGINVTMQPDGSWVSVNVENGVSIPVSSSEEYASIEAASKAIFRAGLSEALTSFSQALATGVQAYATYKSYSNPGTSGGGYYSGDSGSGSGSASSSSGKSGGSDNGFKLSEQQAYNTAKSAYSRYDSQLAAIFAGNRHASQSEIEEIQSKMKSLRQKWEAKGKQFPHFPNEDR